MKKKTKKKKSSGKKTTAEAASPDLEAQIAAEPDAVDPYLVYGDWLQQSGDPRGELIALQAARRSASGPELARLLVAERALLDANARRFYGPLTRYRAARQSGLEWFCGFVRALDGSAFTGSAEFYHHPSARFLRRAAPHNHELHLESAPPLLSHLSTSQHDLGWVWGLSHLRELRVTGYRKAAELGGIRHGGLRLLHIHGASEAMLDALAAAELPRLGTLSLAGLRPGHARRIAAVVERFSALERLTLGLSRSYDGGTYEDLADVAPRVTTLVLDALDAGSLQSLVGLGFTAATELMIQTVFDAGVRDVMFDGDHLPDLPALRAVRLGYPSDLVGYYRGFSRSAIAARVEELTVTVGKPGAGRALVEGCFERLTRLHLGFDPDVGAEYLQSHQVLGSDAFPSVTDLRLGLTRHLAPLAGTPLGDRIERLQLTVDRDRDAREALAQLGPARFPRLRGLVVDGERRLAPELITGLLSLDLEVEWPEQLAGRV
jgi:uncharacterized protein (TIGR02996 family)